MLQATDQIELPDDLRRTKQLLALTGFCDREIREAGRARLLALAQAIAARIGGLASAEGAFFDAGGEPRATPKRRPAARAVPPAPVRVARRALIACALAERARTGRSSERALRVRAFAEIRAWVDAHGIAPELTPEERTHLDLLPACLGPLALDRAEGGYEAVGIFAWALGIAKLPRATELADPALAEKLGYRGDSRPSILDRPALRPHAEIVALVEQMKDADARRWARPMTYQLTEEDKVFERIAEHRRRAARWLLGVTESYADASGRTFALDV